MYARIRRWNRHQAVAKANTETNLATGTLLDFSHTAPDSSPNTTGPTLHASEMPGSEKAPSDKPASEKAPSNKSGFEKAPSDKPHRISPSQSAKKQGKPTTLRKARSAALDSIPEWMDRETTSSALGKRKKRTITQTAQDNFDCNAMSTYYHTRFNNAWKGGTTYYGEILANPKLRGKHGDGSRSIVKNINEKILNSPNDRKIKPLSFEGAVKRGEFGVYPPKRGRKSRVPLNLILRRG